jgi:hypothetical protein
LGLAYPDFGSGSDFFAHEQGKERFKKILKDEGLPNPGFF